MFRTSFYLFTGRFKFHSGKGVCLSLTSGGMVAAVNTAVRQLRRLGEWCILVLLRASRSKWRALRTQLTYRGENTITR